MLRNVVLGSGLAALLPVVRAATPIDDKPAAPTEPPQPPSAKRLSDLPIYDNPRAEKEDVANSTNVSYIHSALLEPVSTVRQQAQTVLKQTDSVKNIVTDNFNHYADKTDWIVKYLREEENKEARYGAVAMGGLTGFIFGLRGGIIRRLFYASIGTTIMGSVCFPTETKELAKTNGALAKQYINIAYNFLYGVKPGDPQLELNFPELSFPKDLSEFADLAASVGSSVKKVVTPPAKEEPKPTEKKE